MDDNVTKFKKCYCVVLSVADLSFYLSSINQKFVLQGWLINFFGSQILLALKRDANQLL